MTFHFPDGNVHRLSNPVSDEIARIQEFKIVHGSLPLQGKGKERE